MEYALPKTQQQTTNNEKSMPEFEQITITEVSSHSWNYYNGEIQDITSKRKKVKSRKKY